MTIQTEAMKLALEALELMVSYEWLTAFINKEYDSDEPQENEMRELVLTAITSLRQAIAEAEDNYQGSDAAKAAHMMDLYTALGVKWGEDPFAVIAKMRSIAEAEKQPTGPATSADRYFYEAGFEAGRQQGMKQERALWELARIGQEIEAEAEPSRSDIKPEQEPVARMLVKDGIGWIEWKNPIRLSDGLYDLHTTPPQRAWVGLTDEQIWEAYMKAPVDIDCHVSDLHKFARAIEAAHGIVGDTHE